MKTVRTVALTAVLVLCAATLIARERPDEFRTATPQELAMTSVDFAPGASAVILDWVQWRDDVDSRDTEYVRIKILSEEGKKYGDVSIPYFPLIANLDKLEARTTKPDGTVVPFTGKTFEKLIVKTGGVRLISKTFSLPDVRPGCIIEYRYTLGMRTMTTFDAGVLRYKRQLRMKDLDVPLSGLAELNKAFSAILADERASAVFKGR